MHAVVHLFWSPIEHESRLFREAKACLEMKIFDSVHVIGVNTEQLKTREVHGTGLVIHRVNVPLLSRTGKTAFRSKLQKVWLGVKSLVRYGVASLKIITNLKPEFICVHNVTLLPVGVAARILVGCKIVYTPHELESQRQGLGRLGRLVTYFYEMIFGRFSQCIVTVCEPIADYYRSKFSSIPVHLVRSIPEQSADLQPESKEDFEADPTKEPVKFIYQGVLSRWRGTDFLIEAILSAPNVWHNRFSFMGMGEAVPRVEAASSRCKSIVHVPALPLDQILLETAKHDIGLFILLSPLPESYRVALPNKFFEYIQAGLPVAVSPNLEYLAQIILDNNIGWVVEPSNFITFASTVAQSDIRAKVSAVRKYGSANTWENEKMKYLQVFGIQ